MSPSGTSVQDVGRDGHPARAHLVQSGLEDVREADQRFQLEGSGASLDRVDRAEDRVDGLGILVPAFHGEQAGFQLGELFLTFLEECFPDCG